MTANKYSTKATTVSGAPAPMPMPMLHGEKSNQRNVVRQLNPTSAQTTAARMREDEGSGLRGVVTISPLGIDVRLAEGAARHDSEYKQSGQWPVP